jgi:5-methylcytosine-specific restriction endonuclease McrA
VAFSSSHELGIADLLALERVVFSHHRNDPNPFDVFPPDARHELLARPFHWRRRAYRVYLRSDAWAAKRAAVLERADRSCERCPAGSGLFPVPLEVHHLTYAHVGDEALEDLQALCADCHQAAHDPEYE